MATIVDYLESKQLSANDPSFASLVFALIRKADPDNLVKILQTWPELYDEMIQRYNAPGGAITASEKDYIVKCMR